MASNQSLVSLFSKWLIYIDTYTCYSQYISTKVNSTVIIFSVPTDSEIKSLFSIVSCTFYFSMLKNHMITSIDSRVIVSNNENTSFLFPAFIYFVQNVQIKNNFTSNTYNFCSDPSVSYCITKFNAPLAIVNNNTFSDLSIHSDPLSNQFQYTKLNNNIIVLQTSSLITSASCVITSAILSKTRTAQINVENIGHLATDYRIFVYYFRISSSSSQILQYNFSDDAESTFSCELSLNKSILSPYFQLAININTESTVYDSSSSSNSLIIWEDLISVIYRSPLLQIRFLPTDCTNMYTDLCTVVIYIQNGTDVTTNEKILFGGYNITSSLQNDNIVIIDTNSNTITHQLTISELNSIQLVSILQKPLEAISLCPDYVLSSNISFITGTTVVENFSIDDISYPSTSLRCQRWLKPIEQTTWNSTSQYEKNSNLQIKLSGFPFVQTTLSYPLNVLPRYSSPIQIIQSDDCFYLDSQFCSINIISQHYGATSRLYLTSLPFNQDIYTFRCTRFITYNSFSNSVLFAFQKQITTTTPVTFTTLSELTNLSLSLENCTIVLKLIPQYIDPATYEDGPTTAFNAKNLNAINNPTTMQIKSFTTNIALDQVITTTLPWSWTPFSVVFIISQLLSINADTNCGSDENLYCTYNISYPSYYDNYNLTMLSHEIDNITQEYIDPSTLPFIYIQSPINPYILYNLTISFPSQLLSFNGIQNVVISTTNIASITNLNFSSSYTEYVYIYDSTKDLFASGSPNYMAEILIYDFSSGGKMYAHLSLFYQQLNFAQPLLVMNSPYYLQYKNIDYTNQLIYEDSAQSITVSFLYVKDPILSTIVTGDRQCLLLTNNTAATLLQPFATPWGYPDIAPYYYATSCLSQYYRICTVLITYVASKNYFSMKINYDLLPQFAVAMSIIDCELIGPDPDNQGFYIYSITGIQPRIAWYKFYSHNTFSPIVLTENVIEIASLTYDNTTTTFSPKFGVSSIIDSSQSLNLTFSSSICEDAVSPVCIFSIQFSGPFSGLNSTITSTNQITDDLHILTIQIPDQNVLTSNILDFVCITSGNLLASQITSTILFNETTNMQMLSLDFTKGYSEDIISVSITNCSFAMLKQPFSPGQFYGGNLQIITMGMQDVSKNNYYEYWPSVLSETLKISNQQNCLKTNTSSSTLCTWDVTVGATTTFPLYEIRGELQPSMINPYIIPNKRYFCYESMQYAEKDALSSTNQLQNVIQNFFGNVPSAAKLELNLIDVCAYEEDINDVIYHYFSYDDAECLQFSNPRATRLLRIKPISNQTITSSQQCFFSFSSSQSLSYKHTQKTLSIPYNVNTETLDVEPIISSSSNLYNSWQSNAQNVSGVITNSITMNFSRFTDANDAGSIISPRSDILSYQDIFNQIFISATLPISLYGKLLSSTFSSFTFNSSLSQIIPAIYTLYINNTVYIDIYDTFPIEKPISCYQLVSKSSSASYMSISSVVVGIIYPVSLSPSSITFPSIPNYTFDLPSKATSSSVGLRLVMQDTFPSGTQCQADLTFNMLFPTHPASIQHDVTIINAKVDMNYNMSNILSTFQTTLQYPKYVKTSQILVKY